MLPSAPVSTLHVIVSWYADVPNLRSTKACLAPSAKLVSVAFMEIVSK